MGRKLQIGMSVIYVDEFRRERPALVTNQFGGEGGFDVDEFIAKHGCGPSANLVFVSLDESKIDQYGRQKEHECSVAHITAKPMREGKYWKFPGE